MQAQLNAAVARTPVVVPVSAAVTGTTGAISQFAAAQETAATATLGLASAQQLENTALARGIPLLNAAAIASEQDAAASEAAGAAKTRNVASTRLLAQQQTLAAAAAQKLAFSQAEVAGASSEVAAAQVILTRSTAAVVAAERALGAALNAKNIALIDAASQSVRLAQAQALEAETALAAARAQAVHNATLGNVGTAAGASAASMLGLRGAVLTAGAAFLGATVAFQAFGRSVGLAAQLERELNVFQVTAGATADQMGRVSQQARELGRDITLPGVAAQDAAAAMSQLSRAGLSVEDSLAAARGTLQLATAAQIDNAQAAELVANSLNSFQLEGAEATRVADLLAGAANASQGSISDMGLALRQAAAVANLVGLSIEETVTLLTQLSRAGLSSSDAGTSLRTTLLRLVGDFPKVSAEVERLGIQLRGVDGAIRPEFFADLGQRLQRMAPSARQATLALLGGSDAIRAIGILSRSSTTDLQRLESQISKSGTAAEVAGAQTQGLGGDVEGAKNEFADFGTTVGQVASGPLSLLVRTAGAAVGAVNDLTNAAREADQGFGETFGDFINRFSESFAQLNFRFQTGVRLALTTADNFGVLGSAAQSTTNAVEGLADAFEKLGNEITAGQGTPQDQGLGVQQILNRVEGLDAAEVRARISGNTSELLSVLQQQQSFLKGQLDRQFVSNRPELKRRLEQALLGTVNDIASVQKQGAQATKTAADEARRAKDEADRALLDLLGGQRQDLANSATAAAAEGNTRAAIQLQERLQILIRIQIAKIRASIKDEQARKEAIRQLRQAKNASQREEEALEAQLAQERAERQNTIQQLNIDIAIETGNDAAAAQAIQKRIATLNKQIAAAKGDQVKVKQLILERARLINQLKDLNQQNQDTRDQGRTAQQFFFEQLQAQQGFASNLLGNLIPRDQTAGLVGVPSLGPGRQINAEAAAAAGRAQTGPTAGQAQTTNAILQRILAELKALNSSASAPEAVYQKKMGAAAMSGGGGNVEVM